MLPTTIRTMKQHSAPVGAASPGSKTTYVDPRAGQGTVFDAIGDAFVLVGPDGRIEAFNRAAQEMFGYAAAEVVGEPLSLLIPERMRATHERHVDDQAAGRRHPPGPGRPPVPGRRRNGEEFPAEISLAAIDIDGERLMAATIRDVSGRVATERALVESERRFRVTFEESPVAMALVDLDGSFIAGNRALADQTGYSLTQLTGMRLEDLVDPDDLPIVTTGIEGLLAGVDRVVRMELRQHTAAGAAIVIDLSLALVTDPDGTARHVIGQALDVTERVRWQERLEETVRSKDELIASISHELRTPLTAMVGFTQILSEAPGTLSEDERSELLRTVVTESGDLANIIEDLLVAAKADTGDLAVVEVPVDLGAEVERILESWPRSEAAHVVVAGSPTAAVGDPGRVRQIIRNLLSNALRYGGGRIWIVLDGDEAAARVTVCDDGPALSPEDADRIFQPYQRAHPTVGVTASMGLGLAISRQLARLMGGELTLRRVAGGNGFELTLPSVVSER